MQYHFEVRKGFQSKVLWAALLIAGLSFVAVGWLYFKDFRYVTINVSHVSVDSPQGESIVKSVLFLKNKTKNAYESSEQYFLSGHLYSSTGELVENDLPRVVIQLKPGAAQRVELTFPAPTQKGGYVIVFDLVKEGEYWLAEKGNRTAKAELTVE